MPSRNRSIVRLIAGLLLGFLIVHSAEAAALDPKLQAELLQIFDSYNQAIGAGKIDEAMVFRSKQARDEIQKELTDAQKRGQFLEFSAMMIPDKLDVKHGKLSADGDTASILTVASKKIPETQKDPNGPPPGSIQTAELTLEFVKEDGQWKYSTQIFGMNPDRIIACRDDKFEPIEAYDTDKTVNAGGPIVRVTFEAEYTLVVFRVLDEETCSYLPAKATIEKAGFNTALLVPYAIVEMDGFPHKTNKQKMWVDHISVHKE